MITDKISLLFMFMSLNQFIIETSSFSALPYVHIDFEHYFRLAQCEAKCTEKYGFITEKTLLEGTQRKYFNVSSNEYLSCERGCTHGRLLTKKHTRSAIETAYKDGQLFWLESDLHNDTNGNSPIESVDILCINPSGDSTSEIIDSFNVKLSAKIKSDYIAPIRFIIQWKQLIYHESGVKSETKWITGSIEKCSLINVEQLQPNIFYQFQITVIGTTGKIGKSMTSKWLLTPSYNDLFTQQQQQLNSKAKNDITIKSQYNSDDGLSALIHYPKNLNNINNNLFLKSVNNNHGINIINTPTLCYLYINIYNNIDNSTILNEIIEKDESNGYLIKNLNYSTNYTIKMKSIIPDSYSDIITNIWDYETIYKSLSCQNIHGKGSLECNPEKVQNLSVFVNKQNSSASITWDHAVDSTNVLLYQLIYSTITDNQNINDDEPCEIVENSIYLSATTTNATIPLPPDVECNYYVKVIAFDLLGREAESTITFHFTPENRFNFESFSSFIVLLVPITVLFLLCSIIHCVRCCCHNRSKKKKIGELITKLPPPENV